MGGIVFCPSFLGIDLIYEGIATFLLNGHFAACLTLLELT